MGGDVVSSAGGAMGRFAVNTSVVLLQGGCAISYFIMVSDLLQQTLLPWMSRVQLIFLELILFVPLAWIRNVQRLWPANLLGSLLTVLGLVLCIGSVVAKAATAGEWGQLRSVPESSS